MTDQPIEITHEDGGFYGSRGGVRLAEMTYRRESERRVVIVHTFVDDALRGLGIARKLLDAAVAWARATGTRLGATCPYAKAQFEKDRSLADVYEP